MSETMSGRPESSQTPTSTEVSRPVESELEQIRRELGEKYALVYQIEALREGSNSLISHVDDAESGETDEEQVVVAEAWRQLSAESNAVNDLFQSDQPIEMTVELQQRLGKLVAGVDQLAEVGSRTDGWLIGQVKAGKDWPEIADLAVRVAQVDTEWEEGMEDEDLQLEIAAVRGDDESRKDRRRIFQAMAIARGAGVEDIGKIAELSKSNYRLVLFMAELRNDQTTKLMTLIDTFQPGLSDDDKHVAAGKMRNLLGITQNLGGGMGTPTEPESEDPPERPRVSEDECKAQLEAQFGKLWDREAMGEVARYLNYDDPTGLQNNLMNNPRMLRAAVMMAGLRVRGGNDNYYIKWLRDQNTSRQLPADIDFVQGEVLGDVDLDIASNAADGKPLNVTLAEVVSRVIRLHVSKKVADHNLPTSLHDRMAAQLLILGSADLPPGTVSNVNVGSEHLSQYLDQFKKVLGVTFTSKIDVTSVRRIVVTSPVEVAPDPVVVAPATPDTASATSTSGDPDPAGGATPDTGGSSSGSEPDPAPAISRVDTADADREARLREGLVEAFGDANVDRLMRKLAEYAGLSEDERKAFWDELKGEDLKDFLRLDGWVLMSSYDAVPEDDALRVAIGKLHDEVAEADSYQTFQIGVRQLINRGEVRAHVSDLAELQKFVNERELGWELEVVGDMIRVKEGEPVEKKMEVWGLDEKSKAQKCLEQAWKAGSSMVARHAEVLADADDEVTDEQVRRGAELAEKLAKIYDRSERREQRVTGYGEAAGYVEGKFAAPGYEVECEDGLLFGEKQTLVVVDGLGGHDGGAEAMKVALEVLAKLDTLSVDQADDLVQQGIRKVVDEADERVAALADKYRGRAPGATMSGVVLKPLADGKQRGFVVWSGDCRVAILDKNGNFRCLTIDHSSINGIEWMNGEKFAIKRAREKQQQLSQFTTSDEWGGLSDKMQMEWMFNRTGVKGYLGQKKGRISMTTIDLEPGEELWLYSDGVGDMMPEPSLARGLAGRGPLSDKVERVRAQIRRRIAENRLLKGSDEEVVAATSYLGLTEAERDKLRASIDDKWTEYAKPDDATLVGLRVARPVAS